MNSSRNTTSWPYAGIVLLMTAIMMAATSAANARPGTRSFTCSGLKDFIEDHGAVVMNHKSASLYQRFVANRGYCDARETTRLFTVPTKTGSCRLKICYEPIDFLIDRDD